MTAENKESPWILFESGALAKGLESSRVCTILIDLLPSDIRPPLSQFNHTIPDEAGLYRLLRTVNSALGEKALKDEVLKRVFETYWPQFEESFKRILKETKSIAPKKKRDENDLMVEVLNTVRSLDRRLSGVESMQKFGENRIVTPHNVMKFYGGRHIDFEEMNENLNRYNEFLSATKRSSPAEGVSFNEDDDDDEAAAPLVTR